MVSLTLLKPTFSKVITSIVCGIVLFLVLSSSCAHGFPDGQPVFPCDTDFSRNLLTILFGCFFLGYPLIYFISHISSMKFAITKEGFIIYVLGLFMAGLVSGALSFYSLYVSSVAIPFSPGIIFSLILGIYLFFCNKIKSLPYVLMFIILSTAGYVAAYFVATSLGIFAIGNPSALIVIPVVSGGIGTFLLLIGFQYFILPLTVKQFTGLIFLGCLLSLSIYIIPDGTLFKPDAQVAGFPTNWLFSLFIFWQAGMGVALGGIASTKLISKKKTTFINSKNSSSSSSAA